MGQTNTIFCINIVITYTDISGCPKKFVAVTTLHQDEFTEILSYFSERWRIYESRYTLSNTWRVNKPRKDETLKLVEDNRTAEAASFYPLLFQKLPHTGNYGSKLWNESR